jgi:hypothetical protein
MRSFRRWVRLWLESVLGLGIPRIGRANRQWYARASGVRRRPIVLVPLWLLPPWWRRWSTHLFSVFFTLSFLGGSFENCPFKRDF